MLSVDDQAKHDLKWIGIWAATTLIFALIGYFGRNAWWTAALVTGAFYTSMAWRVSARGATASPSASAMTKMTDASNNRRNGIARRAARNLCGVGLYAGFIGTQPQVDAVTSAICQLWSGTLWALTG
jgi:hypothetical protein